MDTRTLDHRGIPHSVLTGQDKRFAPVYALFRARLTQEWLRRLNASYWKRAQGIDDAGIHWKKLSRYTIKEKKALENDGKHISYVAPGQLPPNIELGLESAQEQYTKRFNEALNNDKSNASPSTKRRKAMEAALAEQGDRSFAKLINIRTGRLVSATYPGQVVNRRYYPTKDQDIKFNRTSIHISLHKVEYASDVDSQREIIPRNTDVWYIESWNTIIGEVAILYEEMKRTTPVKPKNRDRFGRIQKNVPKRQKYSHLENAPF